jgi:hypothetical protein
MRSLFVIPLATEALAPSFPRAVRVALGKCATVRFLFAAAAAFLMFFLAAARCAVLISRVRIWSGLRAYHLPPVPRALTSGIFHPPQELKAPATCRAERFLGL